MKDDYLVNPAVEDDPAYLDFVFFVGFPPALQAPSGMLLQPGLISLSDIPRILFSCLVLFILFHSILSTRFNDSF
jgi:hypothetical protein